MKASTKLIHNVNMKHVNLKNLESVNHVKLDIILILVNASFVKIIAFHAKVKILALCVIMAMHLKVLNVLNVKIIVMSAIQMDVFNATGITSKHLKILVKYAKAHV
jgi:hypothetical protein